MHLAEGEDAIKNGAVVLSHEADVVLLHVIRHLVHVVRSDTQQKVDVLLCVELLHLLPKAQWQSASHRNKRAQFVKRE